MKVEIFDDMSQCTEAEVQRMSSLIPAWRCEQAMRFKHTFGQYACMKSFLMLSELLKSTKNISSENIRFAYNEHGKPFIKSIPSISIFFNISHCRDAIGVVVSDTPVGLDVESIREASDSLIEKTMNTEEQNQIREAINPSEQFIVFWTRKEALLKKIGTGITDDIRDILNDAENIKTTINHEKQYVWSVAY